MRMLCPKCGTKMRVCDTRTDMENCICYRKHCCPKCGKLIATTEQVTEWYSTMDNMYRAKDLRKMQLLERGE